MKNCLILLATAFAAAPCFAGALAEATPATQPAAWQVPGRPLPPSYRVLLTKSIFSRSGEGAAQGGSYQMGGPGGAPGGAAPGNASMTLRGVVLEQGVYTAIVEDPVSHQIQQVNEGASLAGGHVSGITLRGFQYESGATRTVVAIGHDLHGALAAPIAPPTTQPSGAIAGALPAPGAAADPNVPASPPVAEPAPDQNFASADNGAAVPPRRMRIRVH